MFNARFIARAVWFSKIDRYFQRPFNLFKLGKLGSIISSNRKQLLSSRQVFQSFLYGSS